MENRTASEISGKCRCGNEYPCAPRAAVGVVVLSDEGKILMIRRDKPPAKDTWSVPGGSIELGERLFEAAIREVLEETGVLVEPEPIFQTVDAIYRDRDGRIQYHYLIVYVLARYVSGTVRAASDASDAGWFSLDEIEGLNTPGRTLSTIEGVLKLNGCLQSR
jgi:ADP-ribose pyrophosphatase YjhB (NUDIX family)